MKHDLGLLCAVYGNFDIDKYLTLLVNSIENSKCNLSINDSKDHLRSIILYIATDTDVNYDKIHSVICDKRNISYKIIKVRPHMAMSIGYMRSSLIKYLLGQDKLCKYYYFVDADDYVAPQFFTRLFEQLDKVEYNDGDFYMINGLNVTNNQDDISDNYTSRVFGAYPVYGDYKNPLDLLMSGQATYALWGYVFTPACFIHYLDLYGCYEDAVFIIRCLENNKCHMILNVGYVHREDSNTSLMVTIKKLKEMDKRNLRYQIGHAYKYYLNNPNPATKNLILGLYKYYQDRL